MAPAPVIITTPQLDSTINQILKGGADPEELKVLEDSLSLAPKVAKNKEKEKIHKNTTITHSYNAIGGTSLCLTQPNEAANMPSAEEAEAAAGADAAE